MGGRPTTVSVRRREDEILALCREHGTVAPRQVAAHFNVSLGTVHNYVQQMLDKRLLRKVGHGAYASADSPAAPPPPPAEDLTPAPLVIPDGMVGIPSAIDVPPYLIEAALAAILHAGKQLAAALDHAPEGTAIGEAIEGMLREQSRQGGLLKLVQENTERHRKEAVA